MTVDQTKYYAYIDDDNKDRNQMPKADSWSKMAQIEQQLQEQADGTRSVDLPSKSRHTLDYLNLQKEQ